MSIRAVLFDVGGPIDTEVRAERYVDERILAGLADAGGNPSLDRSGLCLGWSVRG